MDNHNKPSDISLEQLMNMFGYEVTSFSRAKRRTTDGHCLPYYWDVRVQFDDYGRQGKLMLREFGSCTCDAWRGCMMMWELAWVKEALRKQIVWGKNTEEPEWPEEYADVPFDMSPIGPIFRE
jgi:hypothetical protein